MFILMNVLLIWIYMKMVTFGFGRLDKQAADPSLCTISFISWTC